MVQPSGQCRPVDVGPLSTLHFERSKRPIWPEPKAAHAIPLESISTPRTLVALCNPSGRVGGSKYSVMQVSGGLAPVVKRTMPVLLNGENLAYHTALSDGLMPMPYR